MKQTIIINNKEVSNSPDDFKIRVFDQFSGKTLRTLVGHSAPVRILALSPNGKYIISGSDDHTIKMWNIESGACFKTINDHKNVIVSLKFTIGDGFISTSKDGTAI